MSLPTSRKTFDLTSTDRLQREARMPALPDGTFGSTGKIEQIRTRLEEGARMSHIVGKEPASVDIDATEREHFRRTCARLQKDLDKAAAELDALKRAQKIQDRRANSGVYRLAEAYIRHANGGSPMAWIIQPIRGLVHLLLRLRRALQIR